MELIVIEIPSGRDVVEYLIDFAQSQQVGITVLSGSGLVSDVTILLPKERVIDFPDEGQFNMISLKGTYINPNIDQLSPSLLSIASSNANFSIFVSNGDQGQVFGGKVEGKIMAASVVKITAALFKNPEYHKLGNMVESPHEMQDDRLPIINTDHLEHESQNFTNINN
ncbi:AT-hook motif nuclear-localized protein 17-like [Vicia villosa]|uniref:AT-hook motif nuclear-localized protein 17-like n=1 Tax=Vicia villosa TaxID=3911 RepID=UPI00273CA878|nr:AT-hook motif nuclear-localized protein 17-like [Vicia villosa]